uniref:Uncharacterized protein n=1 Tax=Anguilla anguilla TaxID=7936 RepID=A0A0E9P990_ANGAN
MRNLSTEDSPFMKLGQMGNQRTQCSVYHDGVKAPISSNYTNRFPRTINPWMRNSEVVITAFLHCAEGQHPFWSYRLLD